MRNMPMRSGKTGLWSGAGKFGRRASVGYLCVCFSHSALGLNWTHRQLINKLVKLEIISFFDNVFIGGELAPLPPENLLIELRLWQIGDFFKRLSRRGEKKRRKRSRPDGALQCGPR
jgi:hypothetical protein